MLSLMIYASYESSNHCRKNKHNLLTWVMYLLCKVAIIAKIKLIKPQLRVINFFCNVFTFISTWITKESLYHLNASLVLQVISTDVEVNMSLPKEALISLIGETAFQQFSMLFEEISTKWILNAITTGAHVMKGKVFQNIMVDLKVR